MNEPGQNQACISRCKAPVPAELGSVGLCVSHFTLSIEHACTEMHRQIALRGPTAERQAEIAIYLGECALLLARVTSNLCLSDDLKRRMLSTFLSLMNLRENLDRAASRCAPEPRTPKLPTYPSGSELGRESWLAESEQASRQRKT